MNFICLKRNEIDESEEQENYLFNAIDLFYCDNNGILERIVLRKTSLARNSIDVDLTDSMWYNRKSLTKNLPKSNLTTIIDLHKSNKLLNGEKFLIESEKNTKFEENLSKVKI